MAARGKRDRGSSNRGRVPLTIKTDARYPRTGLGRRQESGGLTVKWGYPSVRHSGCSAPGALWAPAHGRALGAPGAWDLHVLPPGRTRKVR